MHTNLNILFKEFANENLTNIHHPTRNKVLTLTDVGSLCDLLFCFLQFEVEEPSLQRIRVNFENDFEKIYNLERIEMAGAIEGLAANFESFLKKIAYVKFGNSSIWSGDGRYKGISKCTLYELIEGKASKLDSSTNDPVFREFPSRLVHNSGISKGILDFLRDLRNKVHSANIYNRTQLIHYSNIILGSYLIAINDNIQFFKKKFFPEFNYLESIANSKGYQQLNRQYIDIYGQEDLFAFDSIAIEHLDGQKLNESLSWEIDQESDEMKPAEDDFKEAARIDSVTNISRDTDRFIIIGEPGSGKTTSMRKILFENAIGILNGNLESRLPVFINLNKEVIVNEFTN